jgi:hypothetical protein
MRDRQAYQGVLMKRIGSHARAISVMCAASVLLAGTIFVPGGAAAIARKSAQKGSVRTVTVPKGWKSYTYRNATISVPPTWAVTHLSTCPSPTEAGLLTLGSGGVALNCPNETTPLRFVTITNLPSTSSPSPATTMVNGVAVSVRFGSPSTAVWNIPSLGVQVAASAPDANRILHTIRRAPTAGPTTRATQSAQSKLPAVVNGVPLLDLAKHALGASEGYSVLKPTEVRMVIATEAAVSQQAGQSEGTSSPNTSLRSTGASRPSPGVPPRPSHPVRRPQRPHLT